MELYGNYTALVTPFKANKEIDYKNLEALVDFQLSHQTDGIVALGSTAEASTMEPFEKRKILECIVNKVSGKIPVIAGVNAFSTKDAILQCRSRFVDGADALLVSPPPYIKPTQSGLIEFFEKVANNSYIPVIIYNIPNRTGVSITPEVVSRLAKHENIIGIKEASGDMSYAQKIACNTFGENFTLITGNDNLLLPMLSINSKAIISVIGNLMPDMCHDVIELYNNGKVDEARKLYFCFEELIDLLNLESNPIPIKFLMSELGLLKPFYRSPLASPSNRTKALIKQIKSQYL